MIDETQSSVIDCPSCDQKLRVPTNLGDLRVTCPKCKHAWPWSLQASPLEPAEHQNPSPDHRGDSDLPWPIVRARTDFLGIKRIVRIDQNRLSLRSSRHTLSDNSFDLNDSDRGKNPWVNIREEAIRSVKAIRAGFITEASSWIRFEIESDHGLSSFRVRDRDIAHVTKALGHLAGDKFNSRPSRRLSKGEIALILGGLVSILCIYFGVANNQKGLNGLSSVGVWLLGFVMASFLYCMFFKYKYLLDINLLPRKKSRRAGTKRSPFRSRLLGWLLKLIGFSYIFILLLSPFCGVLVKMIVLHGHPGDISIIGFLWVFYVPGFVILMFGNRLCARTFEPGGHIGVRRPILFLRAFDDDGSRTFQPTTRLAKVNGISRSSEISGKDFIWLFHPIKLAKILLNADAYPAEMVLKNAFRRLGPLVAIGRPGELLATSGADRMYVPDSEWKAVVLKYLDESQVVVLQPSKTEGVRWEIQQVFDRVPRRQILLSMLNFHDQPDDYDDFRSLMATKHDIQMPLSVPFLVTPSFIYFDASETAVCQSVCYHSPLLWSILGNAVDINRTFETFVSGLRGEHRETPNPPRKHFGHTIPSYYLAYALAIFGYFFMAFFGLFLWEFGFNFFSKFTIE